MDIKQTIYKCPFNDTQTYCFYDSIGKDDIGRFVLFYNLEVERIYSYEEIIQALNKLFKIHPVLTSKIIFKDDKP